MARAVAATRAALTARGQLVEPRVLEYATRRAADEAAALVRMAEEEEAGASLYKSLAHRLESGNAARLARRYMEGKLLLDSGQYPRRSADPAVARRAMLETEQAAHRLVQLQRQRAGELRRQDAEQKEMEARRRRAAAIGGGEGGVDGGGEEEDGVGGEVSASATAGGGDRPDGGRALESSASFALRKARLLGQDGPG